MNAQPHPSRLYHYTDAWGLKGILESKTIWATDAHFLNDAQEQRFGREELVAALRLESASLDNEVVGSAQSARASVLQIIAEALLPDEDAFPTIYTSPFVACFCEDGDLLSQWRGYAGGGGYSIGFNRDQLDQLPGVPTTHTAIGVDGERFDYYQGSSLEPTLVKVQYGQSAVQSLVDEIVPVAAPYPPNHPGATAYAQVENVILPRLAGIKHPAFTEEQEWRLVSMSDTNSDQLLFRATNFGVIPYVQIPFAPSAIAEIVVGPGNHSRLREQSITRLTKANDLESIVISRSVVPFRS